MAAYFHRPSRDLRAEERRDGGAEKRRSREAEEHLGSSASSLHCTVGPARGHLAVLTTKRRPKERRTMAPGLKEESSKTFIECAFCHGTGKDPFGVMSRFSTCYACLGQKGRLLPYPLKRCPYCQGTGVSPIGGRNYCLVCHGGGIVSSREPVAECPACGGNGRHKLTGFYCWPCQGKGAVAPR